MITLAVDDVLSQAENTADLMKLIDPRGQHRAVCEQAAAIESVRELSPDIVWLDVEMPGMNGLEMAAEIKKESPETNIIFVTGFPDFALEAYGMHASGYMMKPISARMMREEISNLRYPVRQDEEKSLRIQCFGNFEAFHNGKLIKFSRSYSKEALAYLVDRRGAGCTVGEICSVLWEDRQADTSLKSQCRVILGSLRKDLARVGAEDVIVKMWNTWGIDTSKISCDYYDFLRGSSSAVNKFHGEYMAQYSWAEMTVGSLYDMTEENIEI